MPKPIVTCLVVLGLSTVIACGGNGKVSPNATGGPASSTPAATSQSGSGATPRATPAPLTPTLAPATADIFSSRAVWASGMAPDDVWRQVCGASPVQVREGDPCIYTVMQRSGANPEAIDFLRRYGYFLAEFVEQGKVDYGRGSAPWFNMGRPTNQLALNGFPALQELTVILPPDTWEMDPRYADVRRREPQAFPWLEYGGIDSARATPDGGQLWTMSFRMAPCRACPDTAFLVVNVSFDKNGALDKVELQAPRSAR